MILVESFNFKKKYGQNFLKNPQILEKIATTPSYQEKSLVMEVGPGAGALTKYLSCYANYVLCYEIDVQLEDILARQLKQFENVQVYFADFLKRDIEKDVQNYSYDHLYFVSNVPYYITTPILFKLLNSHLVFDEIVMLVQKEVGDRFTAKPQTKQYGALTVLLNYYFDIQKCFSVGKKEFVPEPHVDSVVVSFKGKKEKLDLIDASHFFKLVHDSFRFKRKTLYNNLRSYPKEIMESVLEKYGYTVTNRAEEIPYFVFVELSNALCQK